MKVDRRGFLKFVVGGAIGSMATPIPWQLIDESAKWSDTWAPEPPKGPSSFVNSTCRLCPGGCGITLRLVEDKSGRDEWRAFHHKDFIRRPLPAVPVRAIKIEGNPESPINKGGICPLGASGLQVLYGANRIKTPLKRKNAKSAAQPEWAEISWDEALNTVAGKLKEIRESGSPQNLACIVDSKKGLVPELLTRFVSAYGSPNVLSMPCQEDVEEVGLQLMQGTRGPVGYDLENSKYVLSFGAALLEGWGSPVYNMMVFGKWREQGETVLVQVEPNCSATASKANFWLAPKPGTESALALGMAGVIVKEGLYDHGSVARCQGFEGFKSLVESDYGLDKVSEVTGVPKAKIARTAREFAVTKPAVAVYGRGQGIMSGNLAEFMSVYSLNALVGSIGQPGGVVVQRELPFKAWPALVMDAVAEQGLAQGRIDGSENKAGGSKVQNLASAVKGGLGALLVYEANPCYALPRASKFRDALATVPFVVALSSCSNETTQMADIVLPVSSYLERLEDVPSPARMAYAATGLTRPVLVNVPEARHPGDIVLSLANTMGGSVAQSLPWANFEALLKEKVEGIFGSKRGRVGGQDVASLGSADDLWTALNEGKCWSDSPAYGQAGSFQFGSENKMPRYEPAVWMTATKEYPLLVVAYESLNIANRRAVDTLPYMTKNIDGVVLRKKDLCVRVNPSTAGELGFLEGCLATLQAPTGWLRVRVHLDEGTMPGVVAIPLGMGHRTDDPFLAGKGVNAYQILEPAEDPMSGMAVWWGTRAERIKV